MNEIPIKCFSISCFLIREIEGVHQVLLLKRSPRSGFGGEWCQIAGSIEDGETPLQAVHREIEEETSLRVADIYSAMECEQYYRADLNCISILPVFVAYVDADVSITLNHEHTEYRWFDFNDAKEVLVLPMQRKLLASIETEFVLRVPSKWLYMD